MAVSRTHYGPIVVSTHCGIIAVLGTHCGLIATPGPIAVPGSPGPNAVPLWSLGLLWDAGTHCFPILVPETYFGPVA